MPETLTLLMETNSGEASEFVRVFCLEPGVIVAVGSLAVLWVAYACAVRWDCGICRLLHRMWTIPVPVKGVYRYNFKCRIGLWLCQHCAFQQDILCRYHERRGRLDFRVL